MKMKELKTDLLDPAEHLGNVRQLFPWLTRAPELLWDPFSDKVPRSVKDFRIFWICPFVGSNRGSGHFKKKQEFKALFKILVITVVIIVAVSYTHLTLPTNREV